MTEERWIVIPNWDRFQHYRDRDPPWIKLHRGLASDPDWADLSGHRRAVLIGLWLEYAISGRRLRENTATLSRKIGVKVTRRDLQALVQAGFVTFSASKPLAELEHVVSLEGEGEVSIEVNGRPRRAKTARAVKCPHCGLRLQGPVSLSDHVANVHYDLDPIGGDAQ